MNNIKFNLKNLISHAKSYGFVFPSSEIYNGIKGIYDYGQNGIILKNNIKEYWWKYMVQLNRNIVGIDSSIFMHPKTWKASGHIDLFKDLFIENKDSKNRYKLDFLFENYFNNIECKDIEKYNILKKKINILLKERNLDELKKIFLELCISDPEMGSKNWTDIKDYNLMFNTKFGFLDKEYTKVYLRPETAQGIFLNFLNVQKTGNMKIPFGIAQIGKSFRNEIISRQFIFRMKEFEQMEMQFFTEPSKGIEWYEYWKKNRLKWHTSLGLGKKLYRFHKHENLSHYTNNATDIEFLYIFGFKELEGIHYRNDFDLKNHEKLSKKKIQYFDSKKSIKYIPHVVETSLGLDRMFLSIFSSSLRYDINLNGRKRIVLKIPPILSPIKAAILPLVNKDGIPELAFSIYEDLKWNYQLIYDDSSDSIGKKYHRQDAIGTPFCITIDYCSLSKNTVTIRNRDDMSQKKISINAIDSIINDKTNINKFLKNNF